MKYRDLTLDQRISLKGEFQTNSQLAAMRGVMRLWGFVKAVDFFLSDNDTSILSEDIYSVRFP
jgi:hypothetical protein